MSGARVSAIPLIAWMAILLVASSAVAVFQYRLKKGRFKVLQEGSRGFRFLSDFGDITFDGTTQTLSIVGPRETARIAFERIERLDYRMTTSAALAEEVWNGFDLWDLAGSYRDIDCWFELSVVLRGDRRVPLYIVGQYEPKEPLSEWWFELQRGLLRLAGLFRDADATSLDVVKRVQAACARLGNPLSLV